jgi:hypothetical protein
MITINGLWRRLSHKAMFIQYKLVCDLRQADGFMHA